MRQLTHGIILAGSILSQISFAAEDQIAAKSHLQDIFAQCKSAKNAQAIPGILDSYASGHSSNQVKALCEEIKSVGFYLAAEAAGVGTIKNRAMVTWCEGVKLERANTSAVLQKPRVEAQKEEVKLKPVSKTPLSEPHTSSPSLMHHLKPVPESHSTSASSPTSEILKVKLRHVKLGSKAKTVEAEHNQLEEASKSSKANLEEVKTHLEEAAKHEKNSEKEAEIKKKQEKVAALQIQQNEVEKYIKDAQDFYDNLGAIIMGMRLDLKEVRGELKVFKPSEHEHDTPEAYLEAAKDLHKENIAGFTQDLKRTFPGFLEQLPIATNVLHQANENLAKARQDLERINRELVELTQ